jgi:hypothetical protein
MSHPDSTKDYDAVTVCPYCMNERDRDSYMGCCGESSAHFETAYIINDELVLESELEKWLENVK